MARWKPNARERLEKAAMELYRERGYDETAVTDIAARAGLTERTFFRYFADKREVLFWGAPRLRDFLVQQIAQAPVSAAPIAIVASALAATAPDFEARRPFAKARQAIIAAHAPLQERELIKLAALADAIADTLRHRGVPSPTATLAAETGIAVFKLAFERWVKDMKKKDLAHHLRETLDELKAVAAGGSGRSSTARRANQRSEANELPVARR